MPWAGSSLDQLLILPCTRTMDEAAEIAGIHSSRNASIFALQALPRHKRKHPIKVPASRGLYNALGWIIFGSGVDLALHANILRTNQPKWPENHWSLIVLIIAHCALPHHDTSASIRSKCLKAKGCTFTWTG